MQSYGQRLVISIEKLELGPFSGRIDITIFANSPLVKIEAVVRTTEDRRAIFYDAGLVGGTIGDVEITYLEARPGRRPFAGAKHKGGGVRIPVRERAIAAVSKNGSVVLLPPPHQFFFPRDYSNNLGFVWLGDVAGAGRAVKGFGVCQAKTGGGKYVPWFNAPPNVDHRLGVFLVATRKKGVEALTDVGRYSRGDRFEKIPGHVTLTSHWHMAITVAAMKQKARDVDPLPVPSFVDIFKRMGVDMVHLGEFHGDGHQKDGGELRLSELQGMFDECRRLSDEELLFIPGEELPAAKASGAELVVDLDWTFPLAFAEVISGDGEKVYRERIDLSTTGEFGRETYRRKLQLAGRKWLRFEVWDVAQNGAFTQPIWIE